MPDNKDTYPKTLKPYQFHGVLLNFAPGDKEAIADCPFCGTDSKFSVNIETGLFRCFICGVGSEKGGGNATIFIRKLWELSEEATTGYDELAENRKLLNPDTLVRWGICKSMITSEWMVPGYDISRKLRQLYKYIHTDDGMRLLPTPAMGGHQLHGVNGTFNPKAEVIYICEGPWDALALWEVLSQTKETDEGYARTGNIDSSMLAKASIVAVPGCSTFDESWYGLFAGRIVNLMYDSDHPKLIPKSKPAKYTQPAGHHHMLRVAGLLAGCKTPPKTINYLNWGPLGYNPDLPSGYDLRDALSSSEEGLEGRIRAAAKLVGQLSPTGAGEPNENSSDSAAGPLDSGNELEPAFCQSYKDLVLAWRKAMKWVDGMDIALSVMLASIISTKSIGDQLWIKIVGPASCGKSTLCEALSVSKKYVLAKSTIRGFHSGFSGGKDDTDDHSLIAKVSGKTLIVKDGDTLLQSPNLSQILSEARDVYDTVSRTSYRNKQSKDYAGIRMTWLLCGTSSLRSLDQSELGERFLDCVMMDTIDDDLEDEILIRVANKADRNVSIESDEQLSSQQDADMTNAMQLSGGYVEYLRDNAQEILSQIDMDHDARHLCTRLGKFVAFMRARPSLKQDETAEREFAARLVSQHVRLAKCMAAVLNRKTVDEEVMRRVRKVAMDTARGRVLGLTVEIFTAMHNEDPTKRGGVPSAMANNIGSNGHEVGRLLKFMRMIGIAEPFTIKLVPGVTAHPKWRLTPKFLKLYKEVYGLDQQDNE